MRLQLREETRAGKQSVQFGNFFATKAEAGASIAEPDDRMIRVRVRRRRVFIEAGNRVAEVREIRRTHAKDQVAEAQLERRASAAIAYESARRLEDDVLLRVPVVPMLVTRLVLTHGSN